MKWWKRGLIVSVIYAVFVIGVGVATTDVVLAGKITPQQDEAISQVTGMALVFGLVLIWIVSLQRRGKQ